MGINEKLKKRNEIFINIVDDINSLMEIIENNKDTLNYFSDELNGYLANKEELEELENSKNAEEIDINFCKKNIEIFESKENQIKRKKDEKEILDFLNELEILTNSIKENKKEYEKTRSKKNNN